MITGIYIIRNKTNGKVYVGQALCVRRRLYEHKSRLRSGKNQNILLQRAWDKHGEAAFEFIVAERCSPDCLTETEQQVMDLNKAADRRYGYNLSPAAGSCVGVKWSEESRAKASAWQRGRKLSAEHRANVGKAAMGRKKSPETIAKMSARMKGRKVSPETRAKIAASLRGKKLSEACKAKLSAAFKGRKFSAETRQKFSAWQRGRVLSAETRARISETKRRQNAAKKQPACGVAVMP